MRGNDKVVRIVMGELQDFSLFGSVYCHLINQQFIVTPLQGWMTPYNLFYNSCTPSGVNKHATPTALVIEVVFISIDISCLRHLRVISCLRHFTPTGFSRRGRCPHLPLEYDNGLIFSRIVAPLAGFDGAV